MDPVFRGPDGRVSADPLTLARQPPAVDLNALGLLFAPPALSGEFAPDAPWQGVRRVRPDAQPTGRAAALDEAFTAAVTDLIANVETVGVKVSGGLDSLAVLLRVLAVGADRRVVAFTSDLADDSGCTTAPVVRRLITELSLNCELVVIEPTASDVSAAWSALGPRLDALPSLNAVVADRAQDLGVGVLLSGDGADELLGVPRFATAAIARRQGVRAARRYAADIAFSGPGLAGEVLALGAAVFPSLLRARMYWAANWPQWCAPRTTAALEEPYRSAADAWAHAWVEKQISAHSAAKRRWAQADAFDAMWPHDPILAAGAIPEAAPFLHPRVVSAAMTAPLAERYSPQLPDSYLRCKALVVGLLPPHAVAALPRAKQYFSAALARAAAGPVRAPRAVAAGLLDPDALAAETDVLVRLTAAAVEEWLSGAEAAGAVIPGVTGERSASA